MSDVDDFIAQGRRRDARWRAVSTIAAGIAVLVGGMAYLLLELNGCEVNDDRALEAIHAAGMTNVLLGGAVGLACEEAESSRHFAATNAVGTRVEGTVCCGVTGMGKGCTIRWGR